MTKTKRILVSLVFASALIAQDRPVPSSGLIDAPGSYIVQSDTTLRSHGAGILITASNVRLNLGASVVRGPGGKTGNGVHIRGASNVHVSNGYIVNNAFGVIVENSTGVVLTGLQISGEGLAATAPPPEVGIMVLQSKNVVVNGNSIYNTGLGIFVRGGRSSGNQIVHNTVTGGTNAVLGICYNPADDDPQGPRGDLIAYNLVSGFNTGFQFSDNSVSNVVKENTVAYRMTAIEFKNGKNLDLDNSKIQLP
jgi:parallel beta-helix repeat protein